MTLSERVKQREKDVYKNKTNGELLQKLEALEMDMMNEAICTHSDNEILASYALQYGLIKNEISQRIAYGSLQRDC